MPAFSGKNSATIAAPSVTALGNIITIGIVPPTIVATPTNAPILQQLFDESMQHDILAS
jgi:hypothetical protein